MKAVFLLVAALAAAAAWAHGEDKHATKATRAVSTDEHAFGREGDPKKATRTVRVQMTDTMHFTPSKLKVRRGETVRFIVRNNGKLNHEMVIGTLKDLKAHAEMMKNHPGMEHDEPYMAHVAPGKTETIVWQFTGDGTFYFACLEPGHLEAGMIGKMEVVK